MATLNNTEFAEKAQEFLPEDILNELSQMTHSVNLTATCEGHMLMSYIIDYGANLLAHQIGMDEVRAKIWPAIQAMVKDVNEQHVKTIAELRDKYPEAFAEAEQKALGSISDKERKMALLRQMLGQQVES